MKNTWFKVKHSKASNLKELYALTHKLNLGNQLKSELGNEKLYLVEIQKFYFFENCISVDMKIMRGEYRGLCATEHFPIFDKNKEMRESGIEQLFRLISLTSSKVLQEHPGGGFKVSIGNINTFCSHKFVFSSLKLDSWILPSKYFPFIGSRSEVW